MILWGLVPWRVIVGPSLCFGAMNDEFLFFDETSTQDCSFIEILSHWQLYSFATAINRTEIDT